MTMPVNKRPTLVTHMVVCVVKTLPTHVQSLDVVKHQNISATLSALSLQWQHNLGKQRYKLLST